MEYNRYNLSSKKKECSMPIQLQLASDEDFMAALRPSTSGQVLNLSILIRVIQTLMFLV